MGYIFLMKGDYMRKALLFIVIGGIFLVSAVPLRAQQCVKDGITYGVTKGSFSSKWWNYQERGTSYMEGGCFEPALKDIEQAIKLRTAMSRVECDQRRGRTYGMHFVDYFGHREKGVALYHLGRMDESRKEIEFSLSCVESSKAQYYLDLVRKSQIETGALDKTPPDFEIAGPANKSYTKQTESAVQGKAWDDTYVKEIWIAGEPVVIPASDRQIAFSQTMRLSPGWNNFKIRAVDLAGKEKTRDWAVFLDQQGPEVSFLDIRALAGGQLEVTGDVVDDSPVQKFLLNNREVALESGKTFSARLSAQDGKIWFKASDLAGNETEGVVNLSSEPRGARLDLRKYYEKTRELGDRQVFPDNPYLGLVVPAGWAMPLPEAEMEVALTELYWDLKGKYDVYTDKDPPAIRLRGFKAETRVYFPEIYLEGFVADPVGLKQVLINGKSVLKSERKNMFFSTIIQLAPGMNRITLKAVDLNNNVAEKVLPIVREVPQVHKMDERMVVSMLPFYQMAPVPEIGPVAYDNLITSIVGQKRFNFVDRSKVDAIVRELKLSQEQLVDPAYVLKVGKMTAAEGMILGWVKETPNSIEVYAQLVDVESGEVMAEKDAYQQDKSLGSLKFLTQGLAIRLRQAFPIIEGKILSGDGKKVQLDFGKNQLIKPGMRVIFFEEQEIKDADSGQSLGFAAEKSGLGKIIEVYDKMSLAQMTGKGQALSAQGKVITK